MNLRVTGFWFAVTAATSLEGCRKLPHSAPAGRGPPNALARGCLPLTHHSRRGQSDRTQTHLKYYFWFVIYHITLDDWACPYYDVSAPAPLLGLRGQSLCSSFYPSTLSALAQNCRKEGPESLFFWKFSAVPSAVWTVSPVTTLKAREAAGSLAGISLNLTWSPGPPGILTAPCLRLGGQLLPNFFQSRELTLVKPTPPPRLFFFFFN